MTRNKKPSLRISEGFFVLKLVPIFYLKIKDGFLKISLPLVFENYQNRTKHIQ